MMLLNRPRANRLLADNGFDALIATTPENVTYVSGYISQFMHIGRGSEMYALLPQEPASPALVLPSYDLPIIAEQGCWIEDLRAYGAPFFATRDDLLPSGSDRTLAEMLAARPLEADAVLALAAALADRGLQRSRIALDEGSVDYVRYQRLRQALPEVEFVPSSALLQQIRMVKTNGELARLRQATAVNEAGLRAVFESIRPGISEYKVYQAYRETVTALGGTPKLWAGGFGPRGAALFAPSKAITVQAGAPVRLDTVCCLDGYYADMGRSGVVGEPTREHVRTYEALRAGVLAALDETRAGVTLSRLYQLSMDEIRGRGLPEYVRHHCGHGIGLEEQEFPLVAPAGQDDDPVLESNMVLCFECPYYLLGFGGVQFEESVRVTADGYELLTTLDRELMRFS
jgi:Xaa-Pro aminopeptidase